MKEVKIDLRTFPSEDEKEFKIVLKSTERIDARHMINALSNYIKYMIKYHKIDPSSVLAKPTDIVTEIKT